MLWAELQIGQNSSPRVDFGAFACASQEIELKYSTKALTKAARFVFDIY